DKAEYYRNGRTIDDSIAHEFTHYVQYRYQGAKFGDDQDILEQGAIDVQEWFRAAYMDAGRPACSE
ncbi:MAG: hypothetical protein KGL53_07765, partial [Elusimicrobia bacterium]|nr:hypothetical protein [Elusimicrobiota bacterium]